jgi:hypothetical protein
MSSKLPYLLGGAAVLGVGYLLYKRSQTPVAAGAPALPAPANAPKANGQALAVMPDADKASFWKLAAGASMLPGQSPSEIQLNPSTALNQNMSAAALVALMNQKAYVLVSGTKVRFAAANEALPAGYALFLAPGEWQRVQALAGSGYQLTALPNMPNMPNMTGLPSLPTIPGVASPNITLPGLPGLPSYPGTPAPAPGAQQGLADQGVAGGVPSNSADLTAAWLASMGIPTPSVGRPDVNTPAPSTPGTAPFSLPPGFSWPGTVPMTVDPQNPQPVPQPAPQNPQPGPQPPPAPKPAPQYPPSPTVIETQGGGV